MISLISGLLLSTAAHGYFDYKADAPSEMNGIQFKDHLEFPTKWKLVTVRYREDSKELRFTYANDIAWKSLQALKPYFPDGAKFGKVAFATVDDPAFPSSQLPATTRRYQLMVKDRKRFAATDGWGYALFTADGKLFNEDVAEKTMACATCHRIVPERDFVFSRKLDVDPRDPRDRDPAAKDRTAINFRGRNPKDFKGAVLDVLEKNQALESLEGPLQQHAFSGTLEEVIPLLLERTHLTGKSSLLFVNEKNFSLVKLSSKATQCNAGKGKNVSILIHYNGGKVRESDYCLN